MNKLSAAIGLAGLMLVTGCASIKSSPQSESARDPGLTYYLPSKDIQVVVTVGDKAGGTAGEKGITAVSVGVTSAYPDLDKPYVLQYGSNVFAKNTMNVQVGSNGLLTSAKGTSTSKVGEVLAELSKGVAQLKILSTPESATTPQECSLKGEHRFTFPVTKSEGEACGLKVKIEKVPSEGGAARKPVSNGSGASPGVFYRQEEPYKVTVEQLVEQKGGEKTTVYHTETIVASPSASPTGFLPVGRSFFSDNIVEFTFDNGMPTLYKQDTDSEILALVKIPASVISAYFAAVGSIFQSFKSNDEAEKSALTAELKLALEKQKFDACMAAIKAKDDEAIKKLGCSN